MATKIDDIASYYVLHLQNLTNKCVYQNYDCNEKITIHMY